MKTLQKIVLLVIGLVFPITIESKPGQRVQSQVAGQIPANWSNFRQPGAQQQPIFRYNDNDDDSDSDSERESKKNKKERKLQNQKQQLENQQQQLANALEETKTQQARLAQELQRKQQKKSPHHYSNAFTLSIPTNSMVSGAIGAGAGVIACGYVAKTAQSLAEDKFTQTAIALAKPEVAKYTGLAIIGSSVLWSAYRGLTGRNILKDIWSHKGKLTVLASALGYLLWSKFNGATTASAATTEMVESIADIATVAAETTTVA